MLTAKEISDANRHDRATGQRPVGHFDHDANKSTGPDSLQNNGRRATPTKSKNNSDSSVVITLNDLTARL